jgi:hypothetical protein
VSVLLAVGFFCFEKVQLARRVGYSGSGATFDGKPVSFWMDSIHYTTTNTPTVDSLLRARKAFRTMGFRSTHAILTWKWTGRNSPAAVVFAFHSFTRSDKEKLVRLLPQLLDSTDPQTVASVVATVPWSRSGWGTIMPRSTVPQIHEKDWRITFAFDCRYNTQFGGWNCPFWHGVFSTPEMRQEGPGEVMARELKELNEHGARARLD